MTQFLISYDDWKTVLEYAIAADEKFDSEIGGMMIGEVTEDNNITMSHPSIVKQEVSSGKCDLDAKELALYYARSAEEHGDDIFFIWWHSHGSMGVFYSKTDDDTIKEWSNSKFAVSLVVNIEGEYKLRIDTFYPAHLYSDSEKLTIVGTNNDEIEKEVAEKCTKEIARPITYWPSYNNQPGVYQGILPYKYYQGTSLSIDNVYKIVDEWGDAYRRKECTFKEFTDQLTKMRNQKVLNEYGMKIIGVNSPSHLKSLVTSKQDLSMSLIEYCGEEKV